MTQTPPAETTASFANHFALINGQWRPFSQLSLPVSDTGFRQGVTVVERLRTYHGRPFEVARHARRWVQSLADLKMDCEVDQDRFAKVVDELLRRNVGLVDQADGSVGITLFATPQSHAAHLNRIDQRQTLDRLANGQAIVVTEHQSPPSLSWSRRAKVRSRIHYYLADLVATEIADGASGLLRDQDGSITETSIANVAIVESGRVISPSPEQVLPGVTQCVCEQIAKERSIAWSYEPITVQRLRMAEEVLLMGTDTGVWFANQIVFASRASKHGVSEDRIIRSRGEVCRQMQVSLFERTKSYLN